jgi:hypothetical protein
VILNKCGCFVILSARLPDVENGKAVGQNTLMPNPDWEARWQSLGESNPSFQVENLTS